MHWVAIANKDLKRSEEIVLPAIRFDLSGACAGMAVSRRDAAPYDRRLIRINADLLVDNPIEMIQQTVPHEVAHVVTSALWVQARSHGREWKSVMQHFGKPPVACHSMDVTRARRGAQHPYRCACRDIHHLGAVRHKRVLSGRISYSCPRCRQALQPAHDLPVIRPREPAPA